MTRAANKHAERRALFERHRGRCFYSRRRLTLDAGRPNSMTIDHLLPRSRGGSNLASNRVASCALCNNLKRDTLPLWALKALRLVLRWHARIAIRARRRRARRPPGRDPSSRQ